MTIALKAFEYNMSRWSSQNLHETQDDDMCDLMTETTELTQNSVCNFSHVSKELEEIADMLLLDC